MRVKQRKLTYRDTGQKTGKLRGRMKCVKDEKCISGRKLKYAR